MSPSPLVSVILPTYGRPEFLREAVESVAAQSYGRVELVVVDDCSPDPVEPVVERFDTDGLDVCVLRHDENQGASAARNTGIAHASGQLLAFIDDDDRWDETKLTRQVQVLERTGDEVGVVYTGERCVDGDGRVTNVRTPTTSGSVLEDLLSGSPITPFSCLLVDADVADAAGPIDEQLPSWQDKEWYYRLARESQFEAVPEPLVVRRTGHDQISGDYEPKRRVSYPRIVEKHRSVAAACGCEKEFIAQLSRSLAGSAMKNGEYEDAIRLLVVTLRNQPTDTGAWARLFASVGGPVSHNVAQKVRRAYIRGTQSTG
jgi:glycosyltransferase involved in cell wall biosynthesis